MAIPALRTVPAVFRSAALAGAAASLVLCGCQARRVATPAPAVSHGRVESASEKIELGDLGTAMRTSIALQMYAHDHHSRLPDARRWEDAIQPYCSEQGHRFEPVVLARPGDRLAMNVRLSGASVDAIDRPVSTVLLYEVRSAARSARGLPPRQQYEPPAEPFPALPRQLIVFADGWCWECAQGLPPAPAYNQKAI